MIGRILTGLLLFIVVVAAAFFGNRRSDREIVTPVAHLEEPGYAARDAELIETGDDGRPLYTLDAETIRQLPKEGIVTLQTVRVDYRGESSSQWALSAEHGQVRETDDTIHLEGNVHVVGILSGMSDLAQIDTTELSFDPHTQIVRTQAPLRLTWSGREVQATGLIANLKDRRLRLESAVHGSFTP